MDEKDTTQTEPPADDTEGHSRMGFDSKSDVETDVTDAEGHRFAGGFQPDSASNPDETDAEGHSRMGFDSKSDTESASEDATGHYGRIGFDSESAGHSNPDIAEDEKTDDAAGHAGKYAGFTGDAGAEKTDDAEGHAGRYVG